MRKVLDLAKTAKCGIDFLQVPKMLLASFGLQGVEENFWPSLKCLAIMSGFSGSEISVRVQTMKKKGRKKGNQLMAKTVYIIFENIIRIIRIATDCFLPNKMLFPKLN